MLRFIQKNHIVNIVILAITVALVYVLFYKDMYKSIDLDLKNDTSKTEFFISNDNKITIERPIAGDILKGILALKGNSKEPLTLNLKDANNTILLTLNLDAGDFEKEYVYASPQSETGKLEIADFSIPIKFNILSGQEVKVFFSNISKDPELKNCGNTYPVIRHTSDKNPSLSAIISLLVGPNKEEKMQGYFTNLPLRIIKINNFEIKEGIAYVDFSEELGIGVAGSCRVDAIKSQIEETLKQFENIKSVIISIESKADGILQP
ncbi:MAG: GerMN domain-containing protein [Patescibacteria group bacterium]